MPTFDVDVEGSTYEVDAPDERTAWAWANSEHQKSKGAKSLEPQEVSLKEGLARSFGAGATFSFADEAEAKARKAAGDPRSYEKILADVRGKQKAFAEEHPFLDIAGNIVGGVAAPAVVAAVLPEAAVTAGAATGLAALASKLPMAARVAQLAAKYPIIANVAKGIGIGAGYGGASGFGAGEGGLEQRLESAKSGAGLGALFGGAVPAIGKGAQFVSEGVRNVIRPFTASGREKIASRVLQFLPDAEKIAIAAAPESVPGYRPSLAETVESEKLSEIQRQLLGKNISEQIQKKAQESLQKYGKEAVPGEAAAPFVSQQTKYQQALESAKKEIEATAQARAQAASKTAATAAAALKTPTEKLSSEISESAKSKVDNIFDKVREHENSLWSVFSDPENPVKFKTMGGFKNTIADYKAGLTDSDKTIVPKEIWKQLSSLGRETDFREIQSIRSDLLGRARASTNPNDRRVLNELADAIYDGVGKASEKGIGLPKEMLEQWNAARAATANRAQIFNNPYVKNFFREETKQAAPEAFLGRVLGGAEKKSKYQALENALDPFKNLPDSIKSTIPQDTMSAVQRNKSGVMSDLEQFLVTDLGKKAEAEGFVSPKNLKKWVSNYEDLLKARPELRQRFSDVGSLQTAASEAADLASQKITAREIEKLGKFFDIDPYDSAAITRRIKLLVESTDKNLVANVVKQISGDQDAVNGLKRGFVDTILESKNPHEFIVQNKDKLTKVFSSPSDKELLSKIEQTSRKIESLAAGKQLDNETVKNLLSEEGFLPLLLDKSGTLMARGAVVAGAYGAGAGTLTHFAGLFTGAGAIGVPAITRKILSIFYKAPRDKVVDVLKDAFLNPEKAKELMRPIKQLDPNALSSFLARSRIIGPGAVYGAGKVAEEEPEQKAVGGLASLKKRYG